MQGRQTTLFDFSRRQNEETSRQAHLQATHAPTENQENEDVNRPVDVSENPHRIDRAAVREWHYPINVPLREYQRFITQKALFANTLVCLPTGLGKTLIAAVVLYNYARFFPDAKFIFMAPTKALVAQQIEACHRIVGLPLQDCIEMTGERDPPASRRTKWANHRLFFCTPQIVHNDLKKSLLGPKGIALLVFDEAHRATGKFAYCTIIQQLLAAENHDFRVVGLTATPGATKETIQHLIKNLLITKIEIRTEASPDIIPYLFQKQNSVEVVPLSPEIKHIQGVLEQQLIKPSVDLLVRSQAIHGKPLDQYSRGELMSVRETWRRQQFARGGPQQHNKQNGMMEGAFATLMSLYYAHELLLRHGVTPFLSYMERILQPATTPKGKTTEGDAEREDGLKPAQVSRIASLVRQNTVFMATLARTREYVVSPQYLSHPKIDRLLTLVVEHFKAAQEEGVVGTRVMIFANYRDSVDSIVSALSPHAPLVRTMSFVGQGKSKSHHKTITQKQQLELIKDFQAGNYNTLVCTSIGEEGLDIGEVDLIVLFDSQGSSIRTLQRMGRTGRKRSGRTVALLAEGKEEAIHARNEANYKQVQKMIEKQDAHFTFYRPADHGAAYQGRMIPKAAGTKCIEKLFTIAPWSTPSASAPATAPRAKKARTEATSLSLPAYPKRKVVQPESEVEEDDVLYPASSSSLDESEHQGAMQAILAAATSRPHAPSSEEEEDLVLKTRRNGISRPSARPAPAHPIEILSQNGTIEIASQREEHEDIPLSQSPIKRPAPLPTVTEAAPQDEDEVMLPQEAEREKSHPKSPVVPIETAPEEVEEEEETDVALSDDEEEEEEITVKPIKKKRALPSKWFDQEAEVDMQAYDSQVSSPRRRRAVSEDEADGSSEERDLDGFIVGDEDEDHDRSEEGTSPNGVTSTQMLRVYRKSIRTPEGTQQLNPRGRFAKAGFKMNFGERQVDYRRVAHPLDQHTQEDEEMGDVSEGYEMDSFVVDSDMDTDASAEASQERRKYVQQRQSRPPPGVVFSSSPPGAPSSAKKLKRPKMAKIIATQAASHEEETPLFSLPFDVTVGRCEPPVTLFQSLFDAGMALTLPGLMPLEESLL